MAAVLSDVLTPEHVTLTLQAETQDEALREVIAKMSAGGKLRDPEKFLGEVRAREKTHSTYMGNGVAFPHARTDLVKEIIFGAGRSENGIAFGSESERIYLLFVIAVPKRMVNDYLVCVGALARVVNEEKTRETLRTCATADEFVGLIQEAALLLE
jgi:mannitol/fructose-specific phosphotransferase system IIA component (Ntr-type)